MCGRRFIADLTVPVVVRSSSVLLSKEHRVWALWETACSAVFHRVHALFVAGVSPARPRRAYYAVGAVKRSSWRSANGFIASRHDGAARVQVAVMLRSASHISFAASALAAVSIGRSAAASGLRSFQFAKSRLLRSRWDDAGLQRRRGIDGRERFAHALQPIGHRDQEAVASPRFQRARR